MPFHPLNQRIEMLTTSELIYAVSFTLYSISDLRYRVAPAIEVFFIAAALLTAPTNPLNTILVVMAVAWALRGWPNWIVWLLILNPANWLVLLIGYGVRQKVIGKADLLAAGARDKQVALLASGVQLVQSAVTELLTAA